VNEPDPSTSTLEAARAHARSQSAAAAGGGGGGGGVTVPASSARDLPSGVDAASVIWDELVPGGGYASRRLPRGAVVRLTDVEGDACVAVAVHRAEHTAERLNVADTVKVQWQAYLGEGALLLSDMGRSLMTIVADTSGGHDALCGVTTRATGEGSWEATPNGRDLLALGLAKHGMGRRDLPPTVNLFTAVRVEDDGALVLDDAVHPGAHVELRADLDVILTLANTPHPLDQRGQGTTPVRVTAWTAVHATPDPFRGTSPERERAFDNDDELLAGGAR
jgi:urea carboxylase-associated protein 2